MPGSPKFSLRTRFALGMGVMLLPLVVSAVVTFYIQQSLGVAMEAAVKVTLQEEHPVMHLQQLLLQAAMPVHDYLINGDPAERERFAGFSTEVDRAFEETLAAPFGVAQERALVQSAQQDWVRVRSIGEALLALQQPVGNSPAAQEMKRFDGGIDQAVSALDQVHALTHEEIDQQLARSRALQERILPTSAIIVGVGLGIALAAALALARSVLAPVRSIGQGAIRFGEGDLSYRVAADRQDELGQLSKAFNRMAGKLQQHSNEIALLNEFGGLLQTCQDVEEAGMVVTGFAPKLFPNQSGELCIIAPSRNFVEAIATWGETPPKDRVFTPDDCWALRRGQVHYVADPRSGWLCRHVTSPSTMAQDVPLPADSICVPMTAQGETLGILHLQTDTRGSKQTEQQQETLAASRQQLAVTLADDIALALANLNLRETLRSQAIRDPLTGLFNRRYLEETLERELRRAERRQASLGIIMFDLDHFKKFNDTFGHAAGDIVLREIGTFLLTHVRAEDIGCRYGGEEFLVIFPEALLDDTVQRAEQLREGIRQLHMQYRDQTLAAITVSLGAAVFPDHGSTTEVILRNADAALYSAKREGRDRVMVATAGSA